MASSDSKKSQPELTKQAGVSDFITKPFTKAQFIKKVSASSVDAIEKNKVAPEICPLRLRQIFFRLLPASA
jgi:FixJ family two-component response regulator